MQFLIRCLLWAFLILTSCYAFSKLNPDYGCMVAYVNALHSWEKVGTLYDFAPGAFVSQRHIEAGAWVASLDKYRIRKADGCLMESNSIIKDSFHTAYCAMAYIYESL